MPVLRNNKHEAFAQALAGGKSATEAYAIAGFSPNRQNAARLTTKDDVKKRVEELSNKIAIKAEWTAADRLIALKDIWVAAKEVDHRAAIAAISEANRMQGSHAPAKMEHTGRDGEPIKAVTTIELVALTPNE